MGFNYYASICFKDPGSTGYPGTPTPISPQPTGTSTLRYYQSTVILNILKNLVVIYMGHICRDRDTLCFIYVDYDISS